MNAQLLRFALRLQRRLGWPLLCAAALGAAGITLWLSAIHVGQRAGDMAAARRLRPAPTVTAAPAAAPEAWRQLADQLPGPGGNTADLKRIFALAAHRHIELRSGSYQWLRELHSPFVSFVAVLPVTDSYGHIKAFIADTLDALPHAALDELSFERSDVASPQVNARLRLILTYRDAP